MKRMISKLLVVCTTVSLAQHTADAKRRPHKQKRQHRHLSLGSQCTEEGPPCGLGLECVCDGRRLFGAPEATPSPACTCEAAPSPPPSPSPPASPAPPPLPMSGLVTFDYCGSDLACSAGTLGSVAACSWGSSSGARSAYGFSAGEGIALQFTCPSTSNYRKIGWASSSFPTSGSHSNIYEQLRYALYPLEGRYPLEGMLSIRSRVVEIMGGDHGWGTQVCSLIPTHVTDVRSSLIPLASTPGPWCGVWRSPLLLAARLPWRRLP